MHTSTHLPFLLWLQWSDVHSVIASRPLNLQSLPPRCAPPREAWVYDWTGISTARSGETAAQNGSCAVFGSECRDQGV